MSRATMEILDHRQLDANNMKAIFETHEQTKIGNLEFSGLSPRSGRNKNDNYNSSMFEGQVSYEVDGRQIDQKLIIKVPPSQGAMLAVMQKIAKPFAKETFWYGGMAAELTKVEPKIKELSPICFHAQTNHKAGEAGYLEKKLPWFCWCSFQEKERAIIMLENLLARKNPCFLVDKKKVVELQYAVEIMKNLAVFHGAWWLYRHKLAKGEIADPLVSNEMLKKITSPVIPLSFFKYMVVGSVKLVEECLRTEGDIETADWVRTYRLRKAEERCMKIMRPKEGSSKLLTTVHGDFWSNNMMFCKDPNDPDGDPKMVIIDYQMMNYGHPSMDINYFMYINTDSEFRKRNFEDLLRIYFNVFETYVSQTDVDISFETFRMEMKQNTDVGLLLATSTMPNVLNPIEVEFSGIRDMMNYHRERRNTMINMGPDTPPIYKEIRQRLIDIGRETATNLGEESKHQ